jgi:hypothetical protein
MAWWIPQLACFIAGVVYGVVCTLMVHGALELRRLRAQKSRNLREVSERGLAFGSMAVVGCHLPKGKDRSSQGGNGCAADLSLWTSGARPPSDRP